MNTKSIIYDGRKALSLTGDIGWDYLGGDPNSTEDLTPDKLYSIVSWVYRCVGIRGDSVASMPFVVKRGDTEVYEFDGLTPQDDPPPELEWLTGLPQMLKLVEIANTLGGRAYFEKRPNMLGNRTLQYDWLLPWSVTPIFNNVPNKHGREVDPTLPQGHLLGFWRDLLPLQRPIRFEPDELLYFWLPDYAVEIGPAKNYPARAILQNAGVVANMDAFLEGYFDRGLIKATLLKYKDAVSPDEAKRVKEWWGRVVAGIKNVWSTQVVRGDFEAVVLGEGIKDLRDNVLSSDEKKDIAIGMGVPLSKLDSTASTDSNRDADDRQYIEETIIPAVNWIYAMVNKQVLNDTGYSIVARPQSLRVMQTDETMRASAFKSYRDGGMSIKAVVEVLGIHVPDGIEIEEPPKPIPPALQPFSQQPPPQQEEQPQPPNVNGRSVTAMMDKYEEAKRLKRWLKNRAGDDIDIDEFNTSYLTADEKTVIFDEWANDQEIEQLLAQAAEVLA